MSGVDVLVVNEPFVDDFCRTQRWAARTRGRVLRAPDWLAYTTAVLEQDGVSVALHDFPAKGWDKPELTSLVRREQPRLVVLDSTTPSIYSDIECARICKAEAPECRVIMVGPHATVQAGEVLDDAAGVVDAVARGEYEHTVRDYARAVLGDADAPGDLTSILGLSFLGDGAPVHNSARPLIADLDSLPFPAWHHLDLWDYFDGTKLFPYIDVIGGRGCPFQCMFCLWPQVMHGNRYRLRSPGNIVDELEWVLDRWPGVRKGEFFFEDDTFTVDRKRAHAICDEILRRGLRCTWSVNSRADVADLELFRHMKAAGCRLLLVGFESGDDEMLRRMDKQVRVEQMHHFVRTARKARLAIHGCFVLGLPGETEASMQRTIDFALTAGMDTAQFSGAVPFPGTKYFRYCQEHDLLRARSWDQWLSDGEQSPVVDYPGLSAEIVERYVNQGLRSFYFRPSYAVRFLASTRSRSDLYRKLRGFKNFADYLLSRR